MSGIAGFFNLDAGLGSDGLLSKLCELQRHRGEQSASFAIGNVGLVCQGRSLGTVVEASNLAQSLDGRYHLILDGTLYNRNDVAENIIEQLGADDLKAVFSKQPEEITDAELMLAAYICQGYQGFDNFEGIFALALYDSTAGLLVLARDHFGVKPLHFAKTGQGVLFASQIAALTKSGLIEARPNERVLYRYLRYRVHDDSEQTFFGSVNRLLPGQCAVISTSNFELIDYSSLQSDLKELAADNAVKEQQAFNEAAVQEFKQLFWRSVAMRMPSTERVGATLSGGMDSSAVTAVVCDLMQSHPELTISVGDVQKAFSAVFPSSINDEERYIDAVGKLYPRTLELIKTAPTPNDFLNDVQDFISAQEEPIISTGPFAQYSVMKLASGKVGVLLDGEGSDEMLAGYVPYYLVYFRQLRRRKRFLKLAKEMILASDKIWRLARFKIKDKLSRKQHYDEAEFFNTEWAKDFSGERLSIIGDNLKARLIDDLFRDSTPCSIRYVDRNTSRFDLEARQPFLDTNLVRYIFSLKDEALIKNSWNKRLLSDSIQEILPKEVWARRNKIGFSTPEDEWFEVLKDTFRDIFSSESFAARRYFNQKAVLEAFDAFSEGKGEASTMTFWRMLNVELWLREFVD